MKFRSKIEYLKLRITHESKPSEGDLLYLVPNSFYQSIVTQKDLVEEFYQALTTQLPAKKSMDKENERNVRLQYALDYLFKSIPNLDHQNFLEEALSCLVKNLHFDFTIEDYEIFFKLFKENISKHDPDWNDKIEQAWYTFIERAIDTILKPVQGLGRRNMQ